MSFWIAFSAGVVWAVVAFVIAWAFARKIDNYSIVDAVWALCIGITGCAWVFLVNPQWTPKQLVAAALLAVWSGRLGWHLVKRIARAHPDEDPRYEKLRSLWQGKVASAFFWLFQAQAICAVLLALPFLFIGSDSDATWSVWETAGLVISLIGIVGESLADHQVSHFKVRNHDPKAVCRAGLWNYSRHPNYFFEIVIWLGFYIFACGSHHGWMTLHAPAIMAFLLIRVTGIPATEASALSRKGEAYRKYQATTSPLIPWPPKRTEP
jgi:steroid 5-alpha reductase family enzyme